MSEKFLIYILENDEMRSKLLNYVLSKDNDNEIVLFDSPYDLLRELVKPNLLIINHNFICDDKKRYEILKKYKNVNDDVKIVLMYDNIDTNIFMNFMAIDIVDYVYMNDGLHKNLERIILEIKNKNNLLYNFLKKIIGYFNN